MSEAVECSPRLVVCSGSPGVGKTRFAKAVVELAAARGVASVWGQATEVEGAPPYWLWHQVLAGSAWESAWESDLDPGVARFRFFDAACRRLRAAAAERGLVVVLDDVQWADQPSLLLLRHLATRLAGSRLLIVATYRDTETAVRGLITELAREPVTERVDLGGLTIAGVAEQLDAVRGRPVSAELAARVHELTGGNPFFVGELARFMTADELPTGIPHTISDAVAWRVDRLPDRCRHMLRVASIIGRRFTVELVADIVRRPVLECLDLLDDAGVAGIVEPAGAGAYRFVHELVRDAVEASLPTGERVRLHRACAQAIEAANADRIDPHLSDLARHWACAALGGDRELASGWLRRAGRQAMRELAYEEAARLFEQALEVGASELADLDRHGLLVELASAEQDSAATSAALRACLAAAEVARGLGRPDLLADAALALECAGEPAWDRALAGLCDEALAGLATEPTERRARLLALLSDSGMYLGDIDAADKASRQALDTAQRCGRPEVIARALRARQLARSGPDGASERVELTDRMLAVGRELGSSSTQLWAHLWRVDSCFEQGDLARAAAVVEELAWCAEQVGGPLARWRLLVTRAALAQAHGRFAEAGGLADEAFAAISVADHPAAIGARAALRSMLDHHQGTTSIDQLPARTLPPGTTARVFDALGPAFVLTSAGRLDEAGAYYRQLGRPANWRPLPYFKVAGYAIGLVVAIGQRDRDDVAALAELLEPYRGRHVGSGGGTANYGGPVELYLGKAARFSGRLDAAIADLELALRLCTDNGAAPHAVETIDELAAALAARNKPDDLARARRLATRGGLDAARLGMAPYQSRLARLADVGESSPLTPRESEVAACVANGMTNAQIATRLVVSERTAQNHVQHILTKLGYSRRSQIAVWAAGKLSTRQE